MTTTRVTVASIACSGLPAIRSTSGALAAVQEHMSSGTKIVAPSDNPGGTVRAMSLDSERSRNDKYATNSADALAWLSSVDTAYCQAVSVLQQARTLVLQGLNAGANSASTNEALAQQVDKMRSSLPSVANMVDVPRPD
ncbi:MAG: hypothetical protein ACRDVG_02465, partial [Jatrophihabitantaceae bacterium]